MPTSPSLGLDYERSIRLDDGIHWVGFYDSAQGFHCNPYLVVDGDEAVLLDAGSRPDFSTVMMKVLEIIEPSAIKAIILQHYDPDLCGSVPIFEEMIGTPDLRIVSHDENKPFIMHYAVKSPFVCIENDLRFRYTFRSGRELHFIRTPYAHSAGSFVTYDPRTGVLFSSDLFGYSSLDWSLYIELGEACFQQRGDCTHGAARCPVHPIIDFHRRIMTSDRALHYAVDAISEVAPRSLAPQHGSIIHRPDDVRGAIQLLRHLTDVGIDGYVRRQ